MKPYLVIIVFIFIILVACKNKSDETPEAVIATEKNTDIQVYDFNSFEPLLHKNDGKTYIVNFWATWCKPCIKELPYFEEIGENYKNQNVEVLLVSLDFSEKLKSHVIPFIEKHNLKSKVVLLDDVNSNRWIPIVSESWSGAIPATVIYNNHKRKFYEGAFTYKQLETELKTFLP
ncbi:MAG TPA: TlpA disulfide reductase family protein [Flavobacteriaceae bacterium]|nr:TlpA disulfide reductase family protein [Flavobacteriaceae bacterium]